MSQAELARRVGITQPTVADLLSGKSQGSKHLHKIARVLGTTPERLLGEPSIPALADRRIGFSGFPAERDPDQAEVRVLDLALGFGANYFDVPVKEERQSFSRAWLRSYTRADPDQVVIAHGVGDSMAPTLLDSDLLIIDTSQQTLNIADKIWAIAYGEVGGVKRLRPLPGGGVQMIADNPQVPDAVAYDGELHILGRVVGVVRKM